MCTWPDDSSLKMMMNLNKNKSLMFLLNSGVGNSPVITYAHMNQVDWVAYLHTKGVNGDAYPVSQSVRK